MANYIFLVGSNLRINYIIARCDLKIGVWYFSIFINQFERGQNGKFIQAIHLKFDEKFKQIWHSEFFIDLFAWVLAIRGKSKTTTSVLLMAVWDSNVL